AEVDLARELSAAGAGPLDPASVEVVGYDAGGRPYVFDRDGSGDDRYPLPWQAEPLYPLSRLALTPPAPHPARPPHAVHFDAPASPRSDARRYPGLVGDGDFFTEGYGRREVAPNAFDDMAALDGDGDLDLLKGGTLPVLRVFECAGRARYLDRGWLT